MFRSVSIYSTYKSHGLSNFNIKLENVRGEIQEKGKKIETMLIFYIELSLTFYIENQTSQSRQCLDVLRYARGLDIQRIRSTFPTCRPGTDNNTYV